MERVILIYFAAWAGFAAGSLALAGYLAVAATRPLRTNANRWTPPRAALITLAAATAAAYVYTAALWYSFEPTDANRTLTVIPPAAFAALGTITLCVLAADRLRGRHQPDHRHGQVTGTRPS